MLVWIINSVFEELPWPLRIYIARTAIGFYDSGRDRWADVLEFDFAKNLIGIKKSRLYQR